MATVAGCLDIAGATTDAKNAFVDYCSQRGHKVPENWFNKSLWLYKKKGRSPYQFRKFESTVRVHVPFVLNKAEIVNFQKTYDLYYSNLDRSVYYGGICLGYWLVVFTICGLVNWSKFLFPDIFKKLNNPVTNFWRKYISLPAMFHKKKLEQQNILQKFGFLIPSRLESLIVFIFYTMVSVFHTIDADSIPNEKKYNSPFLSRVRIISDRAAIVSTMMMPLIFMFATRNNILQWISGINYGTFVGYHRHTARIMFSLILLHAVGFSVIFGNYFLYMLKESYLKWGLGAITAGGIIMVQSTLYFRRRWYEVFLVGHIILVATWTVGALFHVRSRGYAPFIYPSIAVWLMDRIIRGCRVLLFGFPKAEVSLFSDDTLKVIVSRPKYWKVGSGGGKYAFVYFLKPNWFWQSHPFTIVESIEDPQKIVLFCKVKNGITGSLNLFLNSFPGKSAKINVAIEGPYGNPTPARYADTAVFIAGGNGISGVFSELLHAYTKQTNSQQRLKLIWVIREWKSLFWFYDELHHLKKTNIETTIYITRPNDDNDSTETEKLTMASKKLNGGLIETIKSDLHIDFREYRPVIKNVITEEIEEATRSIAFVCCANHSMVDEIRYQCARNINSNKRVDFYEQIQTFALVFLLVMFLRPLKTYFVKPVRCYSNVREVNRPFTNYGILPYFQRKINSLINPNSESNVLPTPIQTWMLKTLIEKKANIIVRDPMSTGKSTVVLLHALNKSLKKQPRKVKDCEQKLEIDIDSIILVPTDAMVEKYHTHCEKLVSPLPDCVPHELIKHEDGSETITRVPLTVQFISKNNTTTKEVSTGESSSPQVIVTTLSKLCDMYTQTPAMFQNVKFFAIDQLDFFMKGVDMDGDSLIIKNQKGKYKNMLLELLRGLNDRVQFCFISNPPHPHVKVLNEMFLEKEADELSNMDKKIRYVKDPELFELTNIIKRPFEVKHPLSMFTPINPPIDAFFVTCNNGKVRDFQNMFNLPSLDEVKQFMEYFVDHNSSLKNYAKKYHSQKKHKSDAHYVNLIKSITKKFTEKYPEEEEVTVIVPNYVDITKLTKIVTDKVHILPVSQFLASTTTTTTSSNYIIAGIDTLMHQTALSGAEVDGQMNMGVIEPYADLFHVYMWKVLSISKHPPKVVFALDNHGADTARMSQILAFNNISNFLRINKFT
ncbi:hypothetical protein G210_1336 [Candida maltosa Xu316]|uniref:Uncharacterized protein n=1 Tax=Candida maltosa (strain Xu316) TaxID=1245528 RepID=M3K0G9_CANMX|nr:hypothetical protein G210_1336 [Candida maltosa Xu316]